MAIVDLDRQQGAALLAEMTSTRNLLAYGVRVICTGAFIDTTRDPILTLLSIGVEKLYKLTLGLISLDREHKWPNKSEMQKRGHSVALMHAEVMCELRERTADKSQYVRELVTELEDDPVVVPFIEALDIYGRMGRFYNLDELADAPQPVSPDEAWQNIEQAVLADPAVARRYEHAMQHIGDSGAWERLERAQRERMATAIKRVWVTIAVCGRNHALGETGGVFGFEVHPDAVGRQ